MFQLTSQGGLNLAFPDVCNTPAAAGAPVPTPYPNTSNNATVNPATTATTVLTEGLASLTIQSRIPISNGDEAGVQMGVISGSIMGPTSFTKGSSKVLNEGAPAVRLTDATGQNGITMNCPGVSLSPSQTTVLILS